MWIPARWCTTNLDAVGILLQRMGSMSFGIALGFGFAQYVAKAPFLYSMLAVAVGFGLFLLAEYRINLARKTAE
jgi:hypothetical protein